MAGLWVYETVAVVGFGSFVFEILWGFFLLRGASVLGDELWRAMSLLGEEVEGFNGDWFWKNQFLVVSELYDDVIL